MQSSFEKFKSSYNQVRFNPNSLGKSKPRILLSPEQQLSSPSSESESKKSQQTCRICFGGEWPLISPCSCKGTMRYVHESCLIQWLLSSQRKKCELCQANIYLCEELLSFREIIKKTLNYLNEDKTRCLQILVYLLYLWILKYKLVALIGVYFKTLFQMSAMKMLKILYNAFIIMLILELALEEYGRIKAAVNFFKRISVSIRIKKCRNNKHKALLNF